MKANVSKNRDRLMLPLAEVRPLGGDASDTIEHTVSVPDQGSLQVLGFAPFCRRFQSGGQSKTVHGTGVGAGMLVQS